MLLGECTTWSPNHLIPNCIQGTCVNNTCVCFPGFQHDFVLGKFSNCSFPTWGPILFITVTLFLFTSSFFYSLYVFTKHVTKRTTLWRVCRNVIIASLFFIASVCSFWASNFQTSWYGSVFIVCGAGITAHFAGLIVISALHPVAASKFTVERVWRYELLFAKIIPGLFFVLLLCGVIFGFSVGTEESISLSMAIDCLIVGFIASFAGPIIVHYTSDLIRAMESSGSTRSIRDPSPKFVKVLAKLRSIRLASGVATLLASLLFLYTTICYFTTQTVPFLWLGLFLTYIGLGLYFLQTAHFAKTTKEARPSIMILPNNV